VTAPQQIDPQLLIQQQAAAVQQTRARVLAALAALWLAQDSYRTEEDVQRFLSIALPIIEGGERAVAQLTTAYLWQMYAVLAGTLLRVRGVDPTLVTGTALRGVDPAEVYRRPFVELWTELSRGKSFEEAVKQAGQRLQTIAATDLQLAKTHTARAVMGQQPGIVGYRRVPQGQYTCALCIIASTQRYTRGNLMPIHPACDCGIATIYGTEDPGRLLNEAALFDVHAAIRERFGVTSFSGDEIGTTGLKYRDVLIVNQHGEIGPVLGIKGQKFTGPSDLP
jgi:hypothetical protein